MKQEIIIQAYTTNDGSILNNLIDAKYRNDCFAFALNGVLRSKSDSTGLDDYIKEMDKILSVNTIPPQKLWRIANLKDYQIDSNKGVLCEYGYCSTSINAKSMFLYNDVNYEPCVMEINVLKTTYGVAGCADESEILLPRNTTFKIRRYTTIDYEKLASIVGNSFLPEYEKIHKMTLELV